MRNLTIPYPNVIDITCLLHAANSAGKHLQFETLQEFCSLWNTLFSNSVKAGMLLGS